MGVVAIKLQMSVRENYKSFSNEVAYGLRSGRKVSSLRNQLFEYVTSFIFIDKLV